MLLLLGAHLDELFILFAKLLVEHVVVQVALKLFRRLLQMPGKAPVQ
jgi:hypothetical protein